MLAEESDDVHQIQPLLRTSPLSNEYLFCVSVPNGTLVASQKSYRHYYRCQNQKGTREVCPERYAFNEEKQRCDPAIEVNIVGCLIKGTYTIWDRKNCNYYYECNNGRRTHFSCPPGQRFDVHTYKCKSRELVRCLSHTCRDHGSNRFFIADPNNCQG